MAGNREAYQHHMNIGHNAAWDHDWATAIRAYSQAIHEFQEDPDAHIHLGLSLLNADRLDDALKVYTRAHQLAPDDPTPLEKSADILERMGRLKEAAQQYIYVSDVYLAQRDLDKAIGNWERATQLTPGLVSIHAKLAQAYERIGDKKSAIREYLTLAFNFQRISETEKAIKAVERALRLDRRNPQALNTLRALKSGGEVILPDFDDRANSPAKQGVSLKFEPSATEEVGEADPLGPMGEAMTDALAGLAAHIFESGSLDTASSDALQAMEMQRQDMRPEAIAAYQRAATRLRHPALQMSLGGLLLLEDQPEAAIKHLSEAIVDPNLSPGALHALGQACFRLGRHKQASRYLTQSLQAVDTNLALDYDEASELGEIYGHLLTALEDRSDSALYSINDRFINLLSGKDWKQRIAETRRHLEEIMRDEGDQGMVDFLGTGGSDNLAATVGYIDSYIGQGLLTLAMDEAYSAIETSPHYLPIHVRMAEIMMREGRLRQAINKYNVIARSYMARDENDRAASILSEVLEMAPLDVSIRLSLVDLLEKEGRTEEMLDHYVDLARTYNQLGNFDLSRETYQQAERLAKRMETPVEKIVKIKHSLADMEQMRLDTRRAIRIYEEIVAIAPDDERAYRMLVEMNYSLGHQVEAIKSLDKLLKIYAGKKQVSKIVQILEELVKQYANDAGLRSRLAHTYKQLGRKEEAIEQLDALGELQLEAGLHNDARNTIRQIIDLNPEHSDDYRRLLTQLGG
jgi:tetratricopeptide (TPR) repeat protein